MGKEALNVRRFVDQEQRYADLGQDMKSRNQDAQTSHWHKSRERQDVRARDIHKTRQFKSEVDLANTEAVINRKARMKAFLIHEAAQFEAQLNAKGLAINKDIS